MAGYEWLYGVLSGDSQLSGYAPGGAHRSLAPPGTVPPYVIITFQSGPDTRTAQGVRILSQPLYQVAIIGPATGTATLVSGADRIDDLLKLASGNVVGGYIASCYRESPIVFDELVTGERWTRIGGLYRLLIEQTT
jgi:hypothetical protein